MPITWNWTAIRCEGRAALPKTLTRAKKPDTKPRAYAATILRWPDTLESLTRCCRNDRPDASKCASAFRAGGIHQVLAGEKGRLGAETLAHGKSYHRANHMGIRHRFRRGLWKDFANFFCEIWTAARVCLTMAESPDRL